MFRFIAIPFDLVLSLPLGSRKIEIDVKIITAFGCFFLSLSPLGWNHSVTALQKRLFNMKNMFPYQKATTSRAAIRFMHAGEEEKSSLCAITHK